MCWADVLDLRLRCDVDWSGAALGVLDLNSLHGCMKAFDQW